jgi:hypothetical protein
MTKPHSLDVKVNSFKIRVSNADLDLLHARAKSVNMPLTQYLRWRGLQPIGQLQTTAVKVGSVVDPAKILINKELRQQGHHLDRIAKGINTANLTGSMVNNYLRLLEEIRAELAKLGGYGNL